jgi:hypothetical protein
MLALTPVMVCIGGASETRMMGAYSRLRQTAAAPLQLPLSSSSSPMQSAACSAPRWCLRAGASRSLRAFPPRRAFSDAAGASASSAPPSDPPPAPAPSPSLAADADADAGALPWFVDPAFASRPAPPHQPAVPDTHPALPADAARVPALRALHAALAPAPFLEPGTLLVRAPLPTPPGPALPETPARGRRKRGGSDVGTGVDPLRHGLLEEGGVWRWIVLAQVRAMQRVTGCVLNRPR